MAKKHKNTLIDEAKKAGTYDAFCEFFPGCNGCPLANVAEGCDAEMWMRWKINKGIPRLRRTKQVKKTRF